MNIKPEGLILPNCECFQKKAAMMNAYIDKISVLATVEALLDAKDMNICAVARDYYIAAFIWALMTTLLEKPKNAYPLENCRSEFEAIYDRLRPLIMQRIDYADGVVDSLNLGRKGK